MRRFIARLLARLFRRRVGVRYVRTDEAGWQPMTPPAPAGSEPRFIEGELLPGTRIRLRIPKPPRAI